MSRTDKGPVQKQLLDRAYASRLSLVYVEDYRSDSRLFVLRSSIEEFLP